ncbi:BQ5605_C015g07811 [Microbotryum silenes-dioicae]|uniref:BQ5605_C015g07811 protein n=1 Tax=Microbotryum silenes-dioicae TaxID=796604 RepID=A0A2X0NQM3_9BASI|nr:BQ5605_C015g07811 [Microbotryum silenes-dioicae]
MQKQQHTINVPLLSSGYRSGSTETLGLDKLERDLGHDPYDDRFEHPSPSPSSSGSKRPLWDSRRSIIPDRWLPHPATLGRLRPHVALAIVLVVLFLMLLVALSTARHRGYLASGLSDGAGYDQASGLDWSAEDPVLRNYDWQKKRPHDSLTRMIDALTKAEASTREWLLITRPVSQVGTPIGVAQSPAPSPIRAGPATVQVGAGPGPYRRGSRVKWTALQEEWETGRQPSHCENAPWMEDYAKLHHDIINGKRSPKVLEVMCRKGVQCGGSSDRLLGIFSSLLYAVLTDRALLITWEDLPFELFFDSVIIDWAQPEMPNSHRSIHPKLALKGEKQFISSITPPRADLDRFFSQDVFEEKRNEPSWLQLMTNRGVTLRSFNYPNVAQAMRERGFDSTTAYACMSDFLFRPKPNPLRFIAEYSSFFSLPTVYSIAIQIRTGDDAMVSSVLQTVRASPLLFVDEPPTSILIHQTDPQRDSLNTVQRHSNFFKCAATIAKRYARKDQKVIYYLVTDSHTLEEDALRHFSDRVVITGLSRSHPEIHQKTESAAKGQGSMYDVPEHERRRLLDGTTDALTENWIIGKTDFQILSFASGFGKLPVFMKGLDNQTISLVAHDSDKNFPVEFALTGPGQQDCANLDSWVFEV